MIKLYHKIHLYFHDSNFKSLIKLEETSIILPTYLVFQFIHNHNHCFKNRIESIDPISRIVTCDFFDSDSILFYHSSTINFTPKS